MGYNHFERRLVGRVALLLLTLSLPALLLVQGWAEALVFVVPLLLFQVHDLIRFLRQTQVELRHFVEAIRYRDFTQFFAGDTNTPELQELRHGFNQIMGTFKDIHKEKETQYQNLQRVTALVDTGILSYDTGTGEVVFMNEALSKLLHIPPLKTLHLLIKKDHDLYQEIQEISPGHTKIVNAQSRFADLIPCKLLLTATAFQNDGSVYKLVSFQNVHEALEETEAQAWQKLLSVMTHEIMNSVAPISSLADTLKNRVHQMSLGTAQSLDMVDLEEGIRTIKHRSDGLLRFAETYRNLNKIGSLQVENLMVGAVVNHLFRLMQPTLGQKKINFQILPIAAGLSLRADPNLLDQVLINLLLNAMEAVKGVRSPTISLTAFKSEDQKVVVRLTDNGVGMSREVLEKIFIPFFTTRKQGSGIGLSLSKQIMLLHRGSIQVFSEEGKGTSVTLRFGL